MNDSSKWGKTVEKIKRITEKTQKITYNYILIYICLVINTIEILN